MLPPRVLLLLSPFVHPHLFRPQKRGHGGQLLLNLHKTLFCPAGSALCCLNFNEMPTACPLHTRAKTNPPAGPRNCFQPIVRDTCLLQHFSKP